MIEHLKLAGKVALVQGGSRGIGAAIVQRLAKEGAAVAFTYVSSEVSALEIQDSIVANGGRALAIRADSADEKSHPPGRADHCRDPWQAGYPGQ